MKDWHKSKDNRYRIVSKSLVDNYRAFILINMREVLRFNSFGNFYPLLVGSAIKKIGHRNTNRLFKDFNTNWITKEGLVFFKENKYV